MTAYKLTDQNMQTRNGCQWKLGEWKETSGDGELCGPGWLHAYHSAELAVLFNPIHASLKDFRLFEVEIDGEVKNDLGRKLGATKMRLVKELEIPVYTTTQRVAFGIFCVAGVSANSEWTKWMYKWLTGEDRSAAAAADAACAAADAADENEILMFLQLCAEAAKDFKK